MELPDGVAVRRSGSAMGRSTEKETRLSEQRKYRSWTAQQKIEIVLAGLRGDRSVKEVCREHEISETLYYSLAREAARGRPGGAGGQGGAPGRAGAAPQGRASWSGRSGRKTYELEIAGEALRGWE